jgi:2-succinyl-6-hydroxy-2,4-cyclohexadiene-1-carboxylate synthase
MARGVTAVLALHGFLGLPSDWMPFVESLADRNGHKLPWRALDLWSEFARVREGEDAFAAVARAIVAEADCLARDGGKPIILGYSMGGRLAMRAVVERPSAFAGAIFVSAHPGLPAAAESARAERVRGDEAWARRFEGREPWPALLAAWNSQPVFQGSQAPAGNAREEARFGRDILAAALRRWGLGRQGDLRSALAAPAAPRSLWLSGERDARFAQAMSEGAGGNGTWLSLAGAGHRAPWDRPGAFAQAAQMFIERLE